MSGLGATITVKHNFETAHRLPHIGGKCQSLHGHSWWMTAKLGLLRPPGDEFFEYGIVAEYGQIKKSFRQWIDAKLDHGTMLGINDPLVTILPNHGCKVFVFGDEGPDGYPDFQWPTVEAVAQLLKFRLNSLASNMDPNLHVISVDVQETHVNFAGA